ncbi:pilus assembly protein [Pseudomonas marincola]|uniref:pilus assembly protein n=1 Tax=Pseudomonas marincola TaxID=437900 RepID=UPI0008E2D49A|nr:PilC/PilY family type IV pilus protein [Pseudomonas marincola]SFT66775.1 type IV pilus assembly protein PilY1 [Pseudomonas marincola]
MDSEVERIRRWGKGGGLIVAAISCGRRSVWRLCCCSLFISPAFAQVAQTPLILGSNTVSGNLALVPSVEFPTVISVANIANKFAEGSDYVGYFDSDKCYEYIRKSFRHVYFGLITGADGGGYFTPVSHGRSCAGKWSGNYLNWATTQTIDPFRKALTGGYRSVDTATQTILEKATRDSRGGEKSRFKDRVLSGKQVIGRISPYGSSSIKSSVISANPEATEHVQNYQRNKTLAIKNGSNKQYYSVRVEVCKSAALLEDNCVRYGNHWKPEGLIQRYAADIRFSAFSYLNIDGDNRNGGVLRSKQGYVGPLKREPGTAGTFTNPSVEWDSDSGVLYLNPHHAKVGNSGVINYINKFGELTNQHKSSDPVSELYYAALRYFKKQGNIPAYSNTSTVKQTDKFPVVTDWNDPIQYACQNNFILGIGDVYTHEDQDLPHSDDRLNVRTYTQKVFDLEGIGKSAGAEFTEYNNSAFIAGMAYYANTSDIRSDLPGKQTISTYWVDVRENRKLQPRENNQYWLAAKYGGFDVPDDFGNPLQRSRPLVRAWWHTNNQRLSTNDLRPDNFYVASDAANMVAGLTRAFAKIANEVTSTTTSLATNSTRISTDNAIFQSRFNSKAWSGDLLAKRIDADGPASEEPLWSAAQKLDAIKDITQRNILTVVPPSGAANVGGRIASQGIEFTWGALSHEQQQLLTLDDESSATAKLRLEYLRGDRSQEITDKIRSRPFRQRGSRLGDIVNSDPQYLHHQNFGYANLKWSSGTVGQAYKTFRSSNKYLKRSPLVVVGANDGMLHGFDATSDDKGGTTLGGRELFAYVPASLFGKLPALSDPNYTHRYFVDGTPRFGDVWLGSRWASVVVGSGGAGGNSIFALDVTDPENVGPSSVLWEFSHPRMGYNLGQPTLVALPNERFAVLVTSGYHDTEPDTDGKLWVLDAKDGHVIREINLPTSANLGTPLASDTNRDLVADRAYVADTAGNLWRIDLADKDPAKWGIASSLADGPLFVAKDKNGQRQAITAPLTSAFNQKNQHMVFFGTGSFYRTTDNEIPSEPAVETFYGLIDDGEAIEGRSRLLQQTIFEEQTLAGGLNVRAITDHELTTEPGWYMDLVLEGGSGKGERVLAEATVRSQQIIITTMTPSADPCAFGGNSWVMAVDRDTGSRLDSVYFDTNHDALFDRKRSINPTCL